MIRSLTSGGLPFLLPMLLLSLGVFIVPFGVLAAYSLTAGDPPGLFGNYVAFLSDPFNVGVVVDTIDCQSQIGSGSLPIERLPSVAVRIQPSGTKKGRGAALKRLAEKFRSLPVPVIGRIQDDAFLLDLRCLDDEAGFVANLATLRTA